MIAAEAGKSLEQVVAMGVVRVTDLSGGIAMCVKRQAPLDTSGAQWAAGSKRAALYRAWADMASEIRGQPSYDRNKLALAPKTVPEWHELMLSFKDDT